MPDANSGFPLSGFALVTGASGGLGEHYAEFLVRNGLEVILTDRSTEALQASADRIAERHDRPVEAFPADLTDGASRRDLLTRVNEGGPLTVLVNNAGFATPGSFLEMDPERMVDEINLNCVALTVLTREVLPGMIERGRGAIINVASTAGFQPLPTMSVYAATKAYVRSLSQALWSETHGTGVRILSVCPGPPGTNSRATTAEPPHTMTLRRNPEQVIQSTFRALNRDIPEVIDGPVNQVTARLAHLLPKRWVLPIARRITQPKNQELQAKLGGIQDET